MNIVALGKLIVVINGIVWESSGKREIKKTPPNLKGNPQYKRMHPSLVLILIIAFSTTGLKFLFHRKTQYFQMGSSKYWMQCTT